MSAITVFDPAMCCTSGVCGPSPDQKLSTFSADLQFLETQGHHVVRHNLAQEPGVFASTMVVKALLESHKNDALPIILKDGELISYGNYPSRDELVALAAGQKVEARGPVAAASCCCGPEGC